MVQKCSLGRTLHLVVFTCPANNLLSVDIDQKFSQSIKSNLYHALIKVNIAFIHVISKEEGEDQELAHLTQDKNTRKHKPQESQEFRPFLAGDHKAAMN